MTGIVSYGIGHVETGIASWRLLFLVVGGFTLIWGAILTIWLPDSPLGDNFMKGRQKYIALDRVRDNMTGIENKVRAESKAFSLSTKGFTHETRTGVQVVSSP